MSLQGKKILITAGPTWVALDRVRIISNLASGETGCILADKLKKLGAKVTLLLGPGNFYGRQAGIKFIRYQYFSELAQLLNSELRKQEIAAVVHIAAVADYQPKEIIRHKVGSGLKSWKINLVPTKKLIKNLKKYQKNLFTVGFKFEPDASKDKLVTKGRELLKEANLNLVVANSNKNNGYQAYILKGLNKYGPFLTKTQMAINLSKRIANEVRS
jgi:phosphopantothenoylcysteine synthetase/decarboxylase